MQINSTLSGSKCRCGCLGLAIGLLAASLISTGVSAQDQVPNRTRPQPDRFLNPVWIRFEGPINYRMSQYLRSKLMRAHKLGADLIVIAIDSPGGLASESLDLAQQIRDIGSAYTVAFVDHEAISGAALIALGADQIIMTPDARIGDIGVIQFDPSLFAFRFASAKVYSVLVRQACDIAISKGYPPELVEAMIDKEVLVYGKLDARGKQLFITRRAVPNQQPAPTLDGDWKLVTESGPERFLTLNGVRAKSLDFAHAVVQSKDELSSLLHVEKPYREFEYTFTDSLVYFLNLPVITGLLMIVGLVALYIEFSAPGLGAGGLIATLCAVLFFWSRFLGGTSGILEIVLFLAGLAFLLIELFVIPGWGLAGFMGIGLLFVSVIMASNDFFIPSSTREFNQFLSTVSVLLVSGIVFLIVAGQITRRVGLMPVFNRLILSPPTSGDGQIAIDPTTGKPLPPVHPLVSVGDWGVAESLLRPAGRAKFGHHVVDVVTEGDFIDPGRQVRVISVVGNRIVVEAIESAVT